MAAVCELPVEVASKLAEFCAAVKSGTVQLDIKDGRIVAYRITETGRLDKRV